MACCCAQPASPTETIIVPSTKSGFGHNNVGDHTDTHLSEKMDISMRKEISELVPGHFEGTSPPQKEPAPSQEILPVSPEPEAASTPKDLAIEVPAELTLQVSKNGKQLGLSLVDGGPVIFVEDVVADGVVHDYNQGNPQSVLSKGDYIVSVNGVFTPQAMLDRLREDDAFEIAVRKVREITLSVPKDGTLGLDMFYCEDKDYMIVKKIRADGSVFAYNQTAENGQVFKAPSRIVAVAGKRGNSTELFKQLQSATSHVELTVSQAIL